MVYLTLIVKRHDKNTYYVVRSVSLFIHFRHLKFDDQICLFVCCVQVKPILIFFFQIHYTNIIIITALKFFVFHQRNLGVEAAQSCFQLCSDPFFNLTQLAQCKSTYTLYTQLSSGGLVFSARFLTWSVEKFSP